MYVNMTTTSPKLVFNEGEFISRFIRDYYTEEFDFDCSSNEYINNFIQSNSDDYNNHVIIELFISENKGRKKCKSIEDLDTFLYSKLRAVLAKAMKI